MAVLCADLAEAVGNTLVGGGSQPSRRNGLGPPGRWVGALHALSASLSIGVVVGCPGSPLRWRAEGAKVE